jgi:hypothetical protein
MHENWIEAIRYLNMKYLKAMNEHKKSRCGAPQPVRCSKLNKTNVFPATPLVVACGYARTVLAGKGCRS